MRRLGRWVWALGPVALYAGLIVYLSSRSSFPGLSGFIFGRVNDKILHFVEYAALAFLINRAFMLLRPSASLRRTTLLAIALGTAFGLTDEIHQRFVPNRDASLYDLLADFLGSVAGAMAYAAWADLRDRLGRRLPAP